MKKFLLSLSALFCTMGAWAQETVYKLGEPTTNLSSGKYALVCKSEKGVGAAYYHSEGNGRNYRYDLSMSSVTTGSVVNGNYVWIVDVLENGKITIKWANDQTKFFPKDANKNSNFSGSEIAELTPEVKTINGKDYIALKYDDTVGWVHVNSPGGNPNFSYWPAYGDEGTCVKFLFHPVTEATTTELTYTLTDEAGNVFTGTYTGVKGSSEPVLSGVAGYSFENKSWNESTFTATVTFPFPVSKVAGVTNATMIHQGSWNTEKRWHAVGDDLKIQTQDVDPENISEWLWAIYPQFADGAFSFTIKSVSADKYVSVNPASGADVQANNKPVTLGTEGTAFTVSASGSFIKFNYVNTAGTSLHFSINSSRDTDVFLGVYGGSHNGDNIGFPAYSVVTISNVGYSTVYLPFDAVLPEGLSAYAVTATSATSATMTALTGIKANNGAILNGAPDTKYVLTAGTVNSDWSANLLEGSVTDTEVTGAAYVLGTVNDVTGFYSALLTNGKFKNNAGRAYLPVASGARFLSFDFGTETGIVETENETVRTEIYDLSGRRAQKAQNGLFIVNGKVVIK